MKFFRRYILAGKFFLVHFSSVKPLGFFTDEISEERFTDVARMRRRGDRPPSG